MTTTAKRITYGTLATVGAVWYTVPAATTTIVKQIILTNTTSLNATASVSLVPNLYAAATIHRIAEQIIVPAFGLVTLDLSQVMGAGDSINAQASAALSVNIRVSGVEIT